MDPQVPTSLFENVENAKKHHPRKIFEGKNEPRKNSHAKIRVESNAEFQKSGFIFRVLV